MNQEWFRIESTLQLLFMRSHIDLYQSDYTLISSMEEGNFRQWMSESIEVNEQSKMWITDFCSEIPTKEHIRLNHVRTNWDTYIRDRFGAPQKLKHTSGNMSSGIEIFPNILN